MGPQPHLRMAVDPLAGPLINGVMMKTTMPSAIMMVELVASMKLMDGILTAQTAHALILRPPPTVDPLIGPQINGAMMRTTMLTAIMMVELVASMISVDMTTIAMIVNVKSAHHLDGMEITIVMTFSIPEIVNTTGEIAVVTTCLLPTAMIVNALILKPKPGQQLTSTNLKTNTVPVSSFGQK